MSALLVKVLIRLAVYLAVLVVIVILTQDLQIFPRAVRSLFLPVRRDPSELPAGFNSFFLETADGKRLEVWDLAAEPLAGKAPTSAILFHGNGDDNEGFQGVQLWLRDLGISSYSFDYRGFGRSSGWPSEEGINRDADAVWQHVTETVGVPPQNIVLFGLSLGCAPAARLAALHSPHALVLLAPFVDLKRIVRAHPLFGPLAPFLWYAFPTAEYVARLSSTHLLLAHGEADNIVPVEHGREVSEHYRGSGTLTTLFFAGTGHNDLFGMQKDAIAARLSGLLPPADSRP